MSFRKDLEVFEVKVDKLFMRGVVNILETINSDVINGTPVDTGRARGSWRPSIGRSSSTAPLSTDKSGGATLSKANAVAKQAVGKVYWLTSNIAYIRPLEYGHSQQAPGGMVRIAKTHAEVLIKQFVRG